MSEGDQHTDDRLREDPDSGKWADWQGAVLLRDEIRRYCAQDPKLIDPFEDDDALLKPASYHLRVGDTCRVNGDDIELSDKKRDLTIPAHGIAIIRTFERVNIPGFLIARWNLKVKKVYKGLVWVGSLQVDPGYSGFLFCPIYNLSTEPQVVRYKEPLFTIDFVKTTRFDETKGCKLWDRGALQPKGTQRPTESLAALDEDRLRSAPKEQFDEMRGDLKTMEEKASSFEEEIRSALKASQRQAERFQGRIDTFQAITFTVIGILVAALSFVAVSEFGNVGDEGAGSWQTASWVVMFTTIMILTGVLAYAGIHALQRDISGGHSQWLPIMIAAAIALVGWNIFLATQIW